MWLSLTARSPTQSTAHLAGRTTFRNGKPSNDLAAAGVMIHLWDGVETKGEDWLSLEGTQWWSSSIVNARMGDLFAHHPGFVLSPWHVRLLCSYPGDGSTSGYSCPGKSWSSDAYATSQELRQAACVPGCTKLPPLGNRRYCDSPSAGPDDATYGVTSGCPWGPNDLKSMLEHHMEREGSKVHAHYNEVIVDAESIRAQLPLSIEAFVLPSGCSSGYRDRARASHEAFNKRYKDAKVPLLSFDVHSGFHVVSM